jgi:DMSO/TMAO reductase YedYZ molybdopterin-dependent catalytic subunit
MSSRSRGPPLLDAFTIGVLLSAPLAALGFLGSRIGLPFLPYDLFAWITRHLPGSLVTAGIDTMVSVITALGVGPTSVAAKVAEKALAVSFFVLASGVLSVLVALVRRATPWPAVLLGASAGAAWVIIAAATAASFTAFVSGGGAWTIFLCLTWGALLGVTIETAGRAPDDRAESVGARRRFLAKVASVSVSTSAVLTAVAWFVRRRGTSTEGASGGRASADLAPSMAGETSGPAASPPAAELSERTVPVRGTRPEITPNDRFYRIDINLEPPHIDASRWRLHVEGLVDTPLALTVDDLRAMAAQSQVITLECISNRLGGDLISTSLWTGVRLSEVLRRARVRAGVRAVHIEAADGFYESVGMDDANDERTLLVYDMNREPLTPAHGFPLRIYIPNRHGMKQPKWIERLRVSDRPGGGYWVDRGWSSDAIVHTTSVIDTVGMSMMIGEATALPVGGIAYAGARGISRVEVQVDDGPWSAAQLVAPPLSPLTWVLWRYDWPYVPGKHTFRVRAYDGRGDLQPVEERGPRPDGVSGIHEITTRV